MLSMIPRLQQPLLSSLKMEATLPPPLADDVQTITYVKADDGVWAV
jgi:hypothetical protein